jgi:hypothetical protein
VFLKKADKTMGKGGKGGELLVVPAEKYLLITKLFVFNDIL